MEDIIRRCAMNNFMSDAFISFHELSLACLLSMTMMFNLLEMIPISKN